MPSGACGGKRYATATCSIASGWKPFALSNFSDQIDNTVSVFQGLSFCVSTILFFPTEPDVWKVSSDS